MRKSVQGSDAIRRHFTLHKRQHHEQRQQAIAGSRLCSTAVATTPHQAACTTSQHTSSCCIRDPGHCLQEKYPTPHRCLQVRANHLAPAPAPTKWLEKAPHTSSHCSHNTLLRVHCPMLPGTAFQHNAHKATPRPAHNSTQPRRVSCTNSRAQIPLSTAQQQPRNLRYPILDLLSVTCGLAARPVGRPASNRERP